MIPIDPLHVRFEHFELDAQQARLTHRGRPLGVPPKVFGVLCRLARSPGQLVTRSALLDAVWGHRHLSDSALKTTISELRTALGDDARKPRFIETVSRHGYRFIAAADPLPSVPPTLVDLPSTPPRSETPVPPPTPTPTPMPTPTPALPRLIGREAASARLHEGWQRALSGRRQIVWVAGEAGIGKTWLIDRFVAELDGRTVAIGQCVEQHGAGEPYMPVFEALSALCRDDAGLVALLQGVAPSWLVQMPWLVDGGTLEALRARLKGTTQDRMLRELGELLDRYTLERPVLLVTEDLHWCDRATLRLIDHIARRRGPARLMWLASVRVAEVIAENHPLKALRHELRLHRLADELLLDPFSEREVADYLDDRMPGVNVPESLARSVHARTDGLPLFVATVADELVGEQRNGPPDAARVARMRVPEDLVGVIEKQISRASPDERRLLDAASICGVEFSARTVAEAVERDASWVVEHCDRLALRHQWLDGVAVDRAADGTLDTRYAFRHALYRQVLYQQCSASARALLHGRVAASLERRSGAAGPAVAPVEMALHFEAACDLPAALRHYAAAAERALGHFAPAEALHLTERALTLLPRAGEPAARLALEVALLEARSVAASQVLGLASGAARDAFERLSELGELVPNRVSHQLEGGFGWVLCCRGDYTAALVEARRKIAQAERAGPPLRHAAACNLLGKTLVHVGRLVEGRQWLERGVQAVVEAGEPAASVISVVDQEVLLRSHLAQALAQFGEAHEARRQIALARARVDRLGQPYALYRVLYFEGLVEVRLDQPERVQQIAQTMLHIAVDRAIGHAEGQARWLHGWALARLGEPLAGHASIREGHALDVERGVWLGATGVLGCAAEALMLAGRWPEAQRQLDEALALAERQGERLHLVDLLILRARAARARGDGAGSRCALRAAIDEATAQHALVAGLAAGVALCEDDGGDADEALGALAALRAACTDGTSASITQAADALLARRPAGAQPRVADAERAVR